MRRHLVLALMAQTSGAIAVVAMATEEQYKDGRVTGFSDQVIIPYAVMSAESFRILMMNSEMNFEDSVLSITLPPISENESRLLSTLAEEYRAMIALCRIVFSIASVLIVFIIYAEFRKIQSKGTKPNHVTAMKVFAFASSTVGLLGVSYDPFGFQVNSRFWLTSLVFQFQCGFSVIVFILILRIWVRSVSKITRTLFSYYASNILYLNVGITLVVSAVAGTFWYNERIRAFFICYLEILLTICGIGYIICGFYMVRIMKKSHNQAAISAKLYRKIIVFAVGFNVTVYASHIVFFAQCFGELFGKLFFFITAGSGYLIVFSVLFMNRIRYRNSKHSKMHPISLQDINIMSKTDNGSDNSKENTSITA